MSSTTLAQRVEVINHTDGTMKVHLYGCPDVKRQTRINGKWEMVAFNKQEIAEDTYHDQIEEGSMTIEQAMAEHQFYPCVEIADKPTLFDVDFTFQIEANSVEDARAKLVEYLSDMGVDVTNKETI